MKELCTARGIPYSLAPFLQEYRIEDLDPERAMHTLIERTLRFGSRAEIRWLFHRYGEPAIAQWVHRSAAFRLPRPHMVFWQTVLHTEDAST